MDATREQLYRAVCDAPDDESPRRAMADWLVARGDPQGEFIRLQLEAARQPLRLGSSDYIRPNSAADALLARHRAAWAAQLSPFAPKYVGFMRGFPELVDMDAQTFVSSAAEIYRAAPIRMVSLRNARPVLRALAGMPELARLVSLAVNSAGLDDDDLRALVASSHLGNLKRLDVSFNALGDASVDAICAAASRLPRLASVNLTRNRIANPIEEYGEDGISGLIVRDGIALPERGRRLEATYGPQAWLHAPSRLTTYPPWPDEL
jgi:uncharacterized protein (TIGR02996 family)